MTAEPQEKIYRKGREDVSVKEALIKSDVQITQSDFSSDCAKAVQEPVGFQAPFVQYGGKDASKMCIKAYAVIYSEVP